MATRALANLSLEGDKLANRPRGHVITGLLQFENLLCRIITERTRLTFLWKSANTFLFGKAVEMRKRAASKATSPWIMVLSRQNMNRKPSLQHELGAESPPYLVSHSQTACAWQNPSGYVRIVISCLGGRKKHSTKRKGFWKIAFLTLNNFFSFSALCNGIKSNSSIKSQAFVWMATITTITWACVRHGVDQN